MNNNRHTLTGLSLLALMILAFSHAVCGQSTAGKELDDRVNKFLEENRSGWHDLNVPYQDGKVLYDLIVKNNYKSALEIGTSTGHSSIWIAWALSKTGGKLITIEINRERHQQALENLKKAGLSEYVDARVADAHNLVKELKGPFDFVFSDADKDWYTQYFKDIDPKLNVGGCFTAHNVLNGFGGTEDYMKYVKSLPNYETSVNRSSSSGVSISYKRSK
jgi:predicted O-methyltransferase YrrM